MEVQKERESVEEWTSKWRIGTWKSKRSEKACSIGLRSSVRHKEVQKEQVKHGGMDEESIPVVKYWYYFCLCLILIK